MRRVTFATLASLMFIAFLGTLPLTSLAEEGKWTKKADMPTARSYFSTSMVNGKIYAIGGTNLPPATIPAPIALTVEEYDPATDTWTKKSDMPTARSALSTSVVNGKIYVIGGYGTGWTPLRTVEEYDPVTDTWTKKSDMPTARGFLAASVVNGKIYAIGGYEGFILSTSTLSTVEEYDPVTDTWTKKSNMPAVRGFLAASVVNGKIYTIGGDTSHNGPALSTVEEYDPATDTWTKKSDMPTARVVLSTSVVNGKIYAIGGNAPSHNGPALSTVEEYDPATDTWTKKSDMPTARGSVSTSAVNGKIYTIGGDNVHDGPPFSTVEEYDTGFVPQSTEVSPQGKLATLWGKIKQGR